MAATFLEALGQALSQCSALGARTGRALPNCSALSQWQNDCFAIRRRTVGGEREAEIGRDKRGFAREWFLNGLAFG